MKIMSEKCHLMWERRGEVGSVKRKLGLMKLTCYSIK